MKFIVAILGLSAVAFAAPQQQQQPISILRYASDISPEGSYSNNYETEDGISANKNGEKNDQIRITGVESDIKSVSGGFQYTNPDDANGFQPSGDKLKR